jgi:hypothetical protein
VNCSALANAALMLSWFATTAMNASPVPFSLYFVPLGTS